MGDRDGWEKIFAALRKYCGVVTEAMVRLGARLAEIQASSPRSP